MLQTIAVALDESAFSARAVPAAMAVGRAGKASLRLVGIARSDAETCPLRRHLEGAAQLVAADGRPPPLRHLLPAPHLGLVQLPLDDFPAVLLTTKEPACPTRRSPATSLTSCSGTAASSPIASTPP